MCKHVHREAEKGTNFFVQLFQYLPETGEFFTYIKESISYNSEVFNFGMR